jgi:hypothetical protein
MNPVLPMRITRTGSKKSIYEFGIFFFIFLISLSLSFT